MSNQRSLYDPGRTFVVIRHGPYAGRYEVFRTVEDFHRYYPNEPLVMPWWEGRKGDWVLCDDGHVAQIIKRYTLGDPHRRRRLTEVYRVAWDSVPMYRRKDGTHNARLAFSGKKRTQSPSSMARNGTLRHGKHMNSKKKRFAWLVLARGMQPYQAYMAAFDCISVKRARVLSHHLMKEDRLMKEVTDIYKKILDAEGLTQEDIARQIAEVAKKDKSGKTRLDALRLALELRGEHSGASNVNVKFPQLPAGQGPAKLPEGGARLSLPAKSAEIDGDDSEDMEEAVVVDEDRVLSNTQEFRLPNGEIKSKNNPDYLVMQQARSMEKLDWERREGLTKERRAKGKTVVARDEAVTESPNQESDDSSSAPAAAQ